MDLAFMSTGLIFGFGLCPYLDQSIVRIRAITPGVRGRVVSILGFGVFFLSMIFFTLAYARGFLGRGTVSFWICLHIFVQAMFTVGVHMGELRRMATNNASISRPGLFWLTFFAFGAAACAGVFVFPDDGLLATDRLFVFAYESLLSLYGIVFPLYMWAVVVPVPGLRGRSRRARLVSFWVSLGAAIGPFGYGYLAREWWLVGVGVAVAVIAPIVVCRLISEGSRDGEDSGV